jgi:hypothetical protein
MHYKRNQVEEAISRALGSRLSSEQRSQLRRLLETDRGLGRNKRSADPERANFAFYSVDGPGRGVENWFSDYEAFALLTGLRLMQHGWPQGLAVPVLRHVRPELEKEHARILRQDPGMLFDQEEIMRRAQPGGLVVRSTDPVFLVIRRREGGAGPISSAVCRGPEELMGIIRDEVGIASMVFELTQPTHVLAFQLTKTKPSKRGRASA